MKACSSNLREKIAREAANLIYSGAEKEYKQAKLKAAKTYGYKFLPTNLEVAIELDKIAEENEGPARKEQLIHMRKTALTLMQILKKYNPILIGSVWRGTINRDSDIDITVYNNEIDDVLQTLKLHGFKITQTEWADITKDGGKKTSFHIYLELATKEKVEVIIRNLEQNRRNEKCEIYGDKIVGLKLKELETLLKENPTKRFLPFEDA